MASRLGTFRNPKHGLGAPKTVPEKTGNGPKDPMNELKRWESEDYAFYPNYYYRQNILQSS